MKTKIATAISTFLTLATGLHFNVPQTAPADANTIASSAPIGISIEFFEFPNYVQNLPLTDACLNKLGEAMKARPPMRIGGTSQDSAVYNASLQSAISYRWPDSTHKGVPLDLQFGKEYVSLASKYDGPVTFGLNRRLDNLSNTIEAARLARSGLSSNFHAFEIGNEPNFYKDSDPIAEGQPWTASADFSSETHWQSAIGAALNETEPFVQAGVYYGTGSFNTSSLAGEVQAAGTLDDVKTFCHHFYSQGGPTYNLSRLIDHAQIVEDMKQFEPEAQKAREVGREFVFGETNSANQGGVKGLSDTYGSALWLIDYTMQAIKLGAKELLFHHGTIGQCGYCWFQSTVAAPFYGAYTAALAVSGASKLAQLDAGHDRYAAYAFYGRNDELLRVLLLNLDYYHHHHGNGTAARDRGKVTLDLSGFARNVKHLYARRLTGESTDAVVVGGGGGGGTIGISLAGQSFTGEKCGLEGREDVRAVKVRDGRVSAVLQASEALVLDVSSGGGGRV